MWNLLSDKKIEPIETVIDRFKSHLIKNDVDYKNAYIKVYKGDYPHDYSMRLMKYNHIKIEWVDDVSLLEFGIDPNETKEN